MAITLETPPVVPLPTRNRPVTFRGIAAVYLESQRQVGLDAFLDKTWTRIRKQGLAGAHIKKPWAKAVENSQEVTCSALERWMTPWPGTRKTVRRERRNSWPITAGPKIR